MKNKGRRLPPKKVLESAVGETYSEDDGDTLDLDLPFGGGEDPLLSKIKKKRSSLPTVEVSDSDVDMMEDEDDDIEDGSDVEDIQNTRSWGKTKKNFYGGNFVSKDPEEDEIDEDFDKSEARESQMMQLKQLEKLDEEDFADMFIPTQQQTAGPKDSSAPIGSYSKDMGNMTDKERTELFYQESPEFKSIVADFREKLKEAKDILYPAIMFMEKGLVPDTGIAARLIKTKFDLIINYCVNIYSYLIFKSRRVQLKSHASLSGRLVQYKKLLDDLIPLEKEVMKDVRDVMSKLQTEDDTCLSDLVKQRRSEKEEEINLTSFNEQKKTKSSILKPRKKLRILENHTVLNKKEIEASLEEKLGSSNFPEEEDADSEAEDGEDGEDRRAINYQIAKNKGLTPKRNKLQRNPRVKHRVKFEKAKVRRKGQIRTVRTEVKKYSGEISGINARVKKGIKLA